MSKSLAVIALAGALYARYCDEVGGKAFNGDPLPAWDEFRADPGKAKQADAWEAVADEAINGAGLTKSDRVMRAKVKISSVTLNETCDQLVMAPVCKSGAYPADGSDEDNTFAKFSPSGEFKLGIANPALLGRFRPGQKYYVDFIEVPAEQVAAA